MVETETSVKVHSCTIRQSSAVVSVSRSIRQQSLQRNRLIFLQGFLF